MGGQRKVAIFGGTFDPPHFGHISAVAYVLTCLGWDEAFVIPCYVHPFGKKTSPFDARLRMAELAFEVFGQRVSVLDVEARLPVPSYTIRTVEHLRQLYPSADFGLVLGTDVAGQRDRWYKFEELTRMVELVVLPRPGAKKQTASASGGIALFPDISSTYIRKALALGEDISWAVPRRVLEFIQKEKLYG